MVVPRPGMEPLHWEHSLNHCGPSGSPPIVSFIGVCAFHIFHYECIPFIVRKDMLQYFPLPFTLQSISVEQSVAARGTYLCLPILGRLLDQESEPGVPQPGSSDHCSGSPPSDSHSGWLCSVLTLTPSFLSSWLLGVGSLVSPWPFGLETKVDLPLVRAC